MLSKGFSFEIFIQKIEENKDLQLLRESFLDSLIKIFIRKQILQSFDRRIDCYVMQLNFYRPKLRKSWKSLQPFC